MKASEKGLTLLEWALDRWFGSPKPPAREPVVARAPEPGADFYNPLKLRLGGHLRVGVKELRSNTYLLDQMSEFTRRIGKSELKFTDYVLFDEGAPEKQQYATIRVMPGDGGELQFFLFRPHHRYPYSKRLEAKLEGTEYTGPEVQEAEPPKVEPPEERFTDPETDLSYERCGGNDATVREISEAGSNRLSLRYWDFINDEEPVRRLYMAEMDLSDKEGMTETYLGVSISKFDVQPMSGHVAHA